MSLNRFDLEAASESGITVTILDPIDMSQELVDETGTVTEITIRGIDSVAWKTAAKIQKAKFKEQNSSEELDMDSPEFSSAIVDVLSKVVIGWKGVSWEDEEGVPEPLECTQENILMILSKPGFQWLAKQLLAAAGDRSKLFLGNPNS